jgi:hypothetical protein
MPKIISEEKRLDGLVVFRVSNPDSDALDDLVDTLKVIGVRSSNQLARKLVIDYLRGRLAYPHESDRHILEL